MTRRSVLKFLASIPLIGIPFRGKTAAAKEACRINKPLFTIPCERGLLGYLNGGFRWFTLDGKDYPDGLPLEAMNHSKEMGITHAPRKKVSVKWAREHDTEWMDKPLLLSNRNLRGASAAALGLTTET